MIADFIILLIYSSNTQIITFNSFLLNEELFILFAYLS